VAVWIASLSLAMTKHEFSLGISLELLFLHALPLDGSMWCGQRMLLPGATHTPTLYSFGDGIGAWASGALKQTKSDRLIVVGCSVGGSCALEIVKMAPDRVAALVLIGTKADHRPEPDLRVSVLKLLEDQGIEAAWNAFWEPLLSREASQGAVEAAKFIALRQSVDDVMRGVSVFHTRPSLGNILATYPGPIHFVTGADDVAPGYKHNIEQSALAKNGNVYVIERCGHYAPIEQPAQINEILRQVILSSR